MDSEAESPRQNYVVVVRNAGDREVLLISEPLGREYVMPPGAAFEVRAEGPEGDHLQIDFQPDRIVLWAWSGSVVEVYHNGIALGPRPLPVPGVPDGLTVRGFMGMILGQPELQDPD
jgi:hypothetical protein